jgi:hypothetical protein
LTIRSTGTLLRTPTWGSLRNGNILLNATSTGRHF